MSYRATLTPSTELLPTVADCAPRIVGLHPVRIQCDECKGIHEGESKYGDAMNIILCRIRFNPRRYHDGVTGDKRRLCSECAATEWGVEH
jgi:hypothetical protein